MPAVEPGGARAARSPRMDIAALTAPRHPTFRGRLMASVALLSIGVLAVASLIVYLGVRQTLRSNLDEALLSVARTEVTSALDSPEGRLHLHPSAPADISLPTGSGYEKFAEIEDDGDRVVAWTPNLAEGPQLRLDGAALARARAGQVVFGDVRRGRGALRAVYLPFVDRAGRRLVTVVAMPRDPSDRSLRALIGVLVLSLAVGGTVAAWASSRLAWRLTRPLEQIRAAARDVAHNTLGARIPDVSPDVEIRSVTEVLNDMLDRLHAAFSKQEQLITAQRQFVSDASHELRSPLSNLRGTVEVALRRERTSDEYRETLATSLNEVERLSRLVNDLLMLSRADAGQLHCDRRSIDLGEVASSAVRAHSARAQAGGVEVRVSAPDRVLVLADRDRIRQVTDNLLDNALRYAPGGSVVAVSVTTGDGGVGRLEVRDSGPGIPPEHLVRLFDRFYRADRSRARQSGGLGLGLAIARAIVEAHDGRILAESIAGCGAAFRIELPPPSATSEPAAT